MSQLIVGKIFQQHILEVFETMEKDGKLNLSHHDESLHNG